MGTHIHCQPLPAECSSVLNFPVVSPRFANQFREFLNRYNEWSQAKLRELFAMAILVVIGGGILAMPWFLPGLGIFISFCLTGLFYFAVRYYLAANKRVSHLYVNVHILQHHLLGKLEVGFCEHQKPCRCADEFVDFVYQTYHIPLKHTLT